AFHLEEDAARLDDRDPALGRALALAHASFRRLLGDGLVGEDANPDFAAALDEAGHRHARSLDLLAGDPRRLQRLQPILAERNLGAARRHAAHAPALLLAILHSLGNFILSHNFTSDQGSVGASLPTTGHCRYAL